MLWTSRRQHVAQQGHPGSIYTPEHQCILKIQTRGGSKLQCICQRYPELELLFFFPLLYTQLCSEMFKVVMSTFIWSLLDLIDSPVWWWAAGGFLVALILTVAVCWGVCNTRAAGRCGGTGGGFGFNLQPLFTQSLSKVIINRDADGELGAGLLVVQPQASLEMLLYHMVIVAFGIHWKTSSKWHQPHTLVSQEKYVGVNVWCTSYPLTWWVPSVDLGSAGWVPQRWDTSDHWRPHLQIQMDVWIRFFIPTSPSNSPGHYTFYLI